MGEILWKCNSWFRCHFYHRECMKNYKSAPQLKYFRLNALKCAIENSYLRATALPPPFWYLPRNMQPNMGQGRPTDRGWLRGWAWIWQTDVAATRTTTMWTHMCIMCGTGYWLVETGEWIVDTGYRFGSEKFPYLIVFERLPQDDKRRPANKTSIKYSKK